MGDDPTPEWRPNLPNFGAQAREWENLGGAIEEHHAKKAAEDDRIEQREQDRDSRDELMFRIALLGLLVAFLALVVAVAALVIAT